MIRLFVKLMMYCSNIAALVNENLHSQYLQAKCQSFGEGSKFFLEASVNFLNVVNRKKSIIEIGKSTLIRSNLNCFDGGNIQIGDSCYLGDNTRFWSAKCIRIGNRVLIAHNVSVFDNTTHPLKAKERHKEYVKLLSGEELDIEMLGPSEIIIGDDVWIGCNVIILPDIVLGDGCVVGAGSVVTKSFPANSLIVGNPARLIRTIEQDINE